MPLENRVAIVTGSAKGIGEGIALKLAESGADLCIADIDLAGLGNVAKKVRDLGRRVFVRKVDVTDFAETTAMAQSVLDEFGQLDILVNCAGGSARERNSLFQDASAEVWNAVIDLNLGGTLHCTRAVINHMIETKFGKIINIGSTAGMVGATGVVDYSAAKAGVIGFTMALAKEVAEHGINVNCVSPGPIETSGTKSWAEHDDEAMRGKADMFLQLTGFGRLGKPADIGAMVAFLASEETGFITGQNVCVGGLRNLGGAR